MNSASKSHFEDNENGLEQHPFFMLAMLLALICVAANFIPSGVYERVAFEGRTVVDPSSYQIVAKKYVQFQDFFLSFYFGFKKASGLIAMVLFVGGAFGVVKGIGLMEATVKAMAIKLRNVSFIPMSLAIMVLFGLFVSFTGVWELSLVILPLMIPLFLRLGYDVMTGAAVILVGAATGLAGAAANPFFTAIAQNIAELPLYSALSYRLLTHAILMTVGLVYVALYARKVKSDPSKSLMVGIASKHAELSDDEYAFTPKLIRAGVVFLSILAFLIYGAVCMNFSFAAMSGTFVSMGILVGLAYGLRPNEICHMFSRGMGDLMIAAMVIFFARSILFIMEETLVIDTVIRFLASITEGSSSYLAACLMYWVQTVINFFIPSGSGQAAITMPILIPLADLSEINRQIACYASQMGDALSNFIYPTNGALVAILSIAGIPYRKWVQFFGPLFLILASVACCLVLLAQYVNLGPF
ncbi:YfcC family protein [Desulfoluna spongiiphila]|uniref:Uncharacterized membrane protein YfcC, ion transporter superfamily n=1 Tax=Desulfoluna spongiiphila TaxID=419481 RepID=A0A1G5CPP9_9BACT|nr:Na+/H+ antiporter NhaC family protein [Desulfoluna spongiiphila]SCY04445.1 Uncharacterized membrane protein YfcC, ion transporter superfamily [Desulfoluna spongiiphila]